MGKVICYRQDKEKESSYATSVINELGNAKLDVKTQTNVIDQQTNSDFEMPQTSKSASEKRKHVFMVRNSGQNFKENTLKKETYVPAKPLNIPTPISGYDLPLDLSIHNSRIPERNCENNDIRTQFGKILESSMAKSENNNPDFIQASVNSASLPLNETGSEINLNQHQQRRNVKMDLHLSKESPANIEDRKLNIDFASKITVHNNEMVSKLTRQSEISHQFPVSSYIVHNRVQEYELRNMSCPVPIKEYKPNRKLKSSNMSKVEVTEDCTVKCSLNSHENELTFSNQIYQGNQKQIARTGVLHPHATESIQPCFADAIAAVKRPSRSLNSEHSCSICLKVFRKKTTLKLHYQIHSGERPFTCYICPRKFNQKCHLYRHVREVHRGEKRHKCEICWYAFSRKSDYENHFRIHTFGKYYKCDTCKYVYPQKHHLIDHIKSCHMVT